MSSVTSGRYNRAEGDYSSVTGGGGSLEAYGNRAVGEYSSITGGSNSVANGKGSSIVGGNSNTTTESGVQSSVTGGQSATANQQFQVTCPH